MKKMVYFVGLILLTSSLDIIAARTKVSTTQRKGTVQGTNRYKKYTGRRDTSKSFAQLIAKARAGTGSIKS